MDKGLLLEYKCAKGKSAIVEIGAGSVFGEEVVRLEELNPLGYGPWFDKFLSHEYTEFLEEKLTEARKEIENLKLELRKAYAK